MKKRYQALLGVLALASVSSAASAQTLNVGVIGFPREFGHPYAVSNLPGIYTFTAIYDALTFVNQKGEVEPWLALSWRQTSDTTWEFKLRPNVLFSNGEKFTSAAVVASITYLLSPEATGDTTTQELSSLAGVRALDDLTVEITTRTPNPVLHTEVSALRIIAPDYWTKAGPDASRMKPVGTGPFQVVSWNPARLEMTAFKGSWRAPKVDKLNLLVIPEIPSRVQGLLSGKLDVALALRAEDKSTVEIAGHRLQASPGTGVFTIVLDSERDPRFKDVRLRKALNLAVNRAAMSELLLAGLVKPASQFTPPNASGYDPSLAAYPYDPAQAKRLLAEAGYANGLSFTLEAVMGGAVSDSALFQQIAADLAAVGVKMQIRPILISQLSTGMHTTAGFGGDAFATDYGTAPSLDSLRSLKLHSCLHLYPWFCDKEGLPTLQRALSAKTQDERKDLTRQVFKRYHELYPAILLWDIVYFDAVRKGVSDLPSVGTWVRWDKISKAD
ncbi:MAG: ABC transporter substrate-binding protein [Rhodospirillaceae bacterium]|nr:ABC transporter substrate-binding protein [Rhodospirillaceae bacterium]